MTEIYGLHELRPVFPEDGDYWVAPGAKLIGQVTLGSGASVWFNAVIRADNEPVIIGARTNIQDGAVLHNDPGYPLTIGAGVTVGHGAIVHGCAIGDGCLIGMGATVMNGAVIGEQSIVGANALVSEGKTFPARSLILGAPGKMVRTLDDDAVAGLENAADVYYRRQILYRAELTPVD